MPYTRAQAKALLNASEMQLYDDSRINGLRQLDAPALQKRVERARRSRDRARDLVQRQKLALRASTGSKRGRTGLANQRSKDKAGLLGDILKRFETALKAAGKPAKKTAATKAATKTGARTAAARKRTPPTGATQAATRRSAGGKKATAATPAQKAARTRAAAARKRARAVLASRKLLESKTERDRAPKPWQALDSVGAPAVAHPGFQSAAAAGKARQLHAGESRMKSIQGSVSTRDRRNQGKRDSRTIGD